MQHDRPRRQITLYGRGGCHLCAVARRELDRLGQSLGFDVVEIDVDGDATHLARYHSVVPVIAMGETEIARAPLDWVPLRVRLAELLGAC